MFAKNSQKTLKSAQNKLLIGFLRKSYYNKKTEQIFVFYVKSSVGRFRNSSAILLWHNLIIFEESLDAIEDDIVGDYNNVLFHCLLNVL